MSRSSKTINRLAALNHAEKYLEIGVAEGNTFHNVEIGNKTAVDPNFLFDTGQYSSYPDQYYFNMTSDAFFEQLENNTEVVYGNAGFTWDIIFIDGLHVYEQAMRDFKNTLKYSHKNTIWIFDDTVPSDPWAAIPNMSKCFLFRELAGVSGKDWQGDVFKCVFTLHDSFPMFSYATMIGSGNPQTVVWRTDSDADRPQVFKDADAIKHLGYFDMLEKCFLLNPMNEYETLAFVGKQFHNRECNINKFLPGLIRPVCA